MSSEPRRATKIIATVGPASLTEDKLLKLMEAGVDMFRFNFAHGTREEHAQRIGLVKQLAERAGKPVGTLADISGPKIRLGKIPEDTFELKEGETVTFASPGAAEPGLPVQLKDFDQYIQPGDSIYIADGTRRLTATACRSGIVTATVDVGGPVVSFKGINLPFLRKPLPAVCDKDMADIECAIDAGIDWIGLSFVGGAEDVEPVRELMQKKGARRRVLAKLERRQALDHLDEIVVAFDGVMVARGDLGIEVEFEKVPFIQEQILKAARSRGKPVIVATQILLSMIHNPRPTRAEVTDIAHAVTSGADALMLSEETAIGEFAPEAVNTIARVAVVAESMNPPELQQLHSVHKEETALAHTAAVLAKNLGASVILCPTRSGNAARGVARFRPQQPIVVVSDQNEVVGGLTLYRGVYPVHAELTDNLDARVKMALQLATRLGYAGPGDRVVIVGGVPAGSGRTNLLLTHTIPGN
ncbi:pyruvate kinase [candidate division KSB1 bacterium]|nr:MAG: pyruvate kinase [candidate division KSB1 bacterium]